MNPVEGEEATPVMPAGEGMGEEAAAPAQEAGDAEAA